MNDPTVQIRVPLNAVFALLSIQGVDARVIEQRLLAGEKIDVILHGTLQTGTAWSDHDGIDQQFGVDITEATIGTDI